MENKKPLIIYVMSTLKRVGPTNQTLNIIKENEFDKLVITLFDEDNNDTMLDEYKENNINVIQLHMKSFSTALTKGKKILLDELKKYDVSLVHSYGIVADYLSQYVTKKIGIKHIITLRFFPKEDILTRYSGLKGKLIYKLHMHVLKKAKNVVCCSKSLAEKMYQSYKLNFTYIQNGVNIDKFKIIPNKDNDLVEKFNGYDYKFIAASNIIPRKRVEETIKGFLLANINNSCLIVVGEGTLLQSLKSKYTNKNIYFEGKQSNMVKYYNVADFFVSSSESEGLPNSVLEAVSTGLIPILSDIPQHKEALDTIQCYGELYNLGNVESLAKCITEIIKIKRDRTLNREKLLQSELTMVSMGKKYLNYYKKFIGD